MKKNEVTIESLLRDLITETMSSEFSRFMGRNISPTLPQKAELSEILNVQEAAKLLNLAPSTIYGLVHKSKIPHSKKGKKLRFKRSQLLLWIESGEKNLNTLKPGNLDLSI